MTKNNCCSPSGKVSEISNCCDSSANTTTTACCSPTNPETQNKESGNSTPFQISIDGKKLEVTDNSKNLVDLAKEAGITIPAPCYLAKKRLGCCKACVVEVNKKPSYACGTKALPGMEVIVNRDDLKLVRKERLLKYNEAIKSNTPQSCSGDSLTI